MRRYGFFGSMSVDKNKGKGRMHDLYTDKHYIVGS